MPSLPPLHLLSSPSPKPASLLVDTTNIAPAVQLKHQDILVQSVPEESQAFEMDEQIRIFEELINKGQYKEIAELGNGMNDRELLKCLCQVVTDLDHFKGIYEYMKDRNMIPAFLAYGEMVVVKRVILETGLLKTEGCGECDSLYDAIVMSLNEDRHDRVAGLFGAAHEGLTWQGEFDWFMRNFFGRYCPEKYDMPFKRLLALHGKEFSKKQPAVFEAICRNLVSRWQSDDSVSQKLLTDLVGQPSLLTPVAYVRGVLHGTGDAPRTRLIKHGYREALEEGLKEEYESGGRKLWTAMVSRYPKQFSGKYPSKDEARTTALKDFKPTKQDREEEWAKRNVPNLRMKLEMFIPDLPTALLGIVSEYAITWVAFLWSPQQEQLPSLVSEQVAEKFETLMSEKRYWEIVELGNSMENDVLAKHLYPLMTTTEHCMYLNGYLESRDMLPDFLMLGEMEVVKKAILEFENIDSDYYIFDEHICDAIALSIKEHRGGRAISLLRIERERHATADEQCRKTGKTPQFEVILRNFSKKLLKKMDAVPLKRFLTIHREELHEGWPNILEIMCQGVVSYLSSDSWNLDSRKLLVDFVGQSSLITHAAFAYGILERGFDGPRSNFIEYGWREAIEEGLKGKYTGEGVMLWGFMVRTYPTRFSGEYPYTDEERRVALKDFKPTKQDREEAWALANISSFLPKLVTKLQESDISILLPQALWDIVAGYAATGATWVDV